MGVLVLIALATTSVHAAPLTRPEALRAIEKHADFGAISTIPNATHPSFDRGVKDGLWVNTRGGWEPTAFGRQYFTSVNMLGMKLSKPLHRTVVAVTGISDGAHTSNKIVEFTWRFTDLTRSLSDYTGATTGDHAGKAVFRYYDDGWRIISLDCGSVRSGTNSRPFKEEKSLTGFRFLGAYQTDSERAPFVFRLWFSKPRQVVGVVERRTSGPEPAKGKIKADNYDPPGDFDPMTGELHFFTIMDGTMVSFVGSLSSEVVKGVVTLRDHATGTLFQTHNVICKRVPDDDGDRRQFLSLEQWEAQYAKAVRFRPESSAKE